MARKHNVNEINLQINNIEIYKNENCPNGCIRIFWSSNIGFGQYDIFKNDEWKWFGDSEHMDNNDDKDFVKKLMELFVEKLIIQ